MCLCMFHWYSLWIELLSSRAFHRYKATYGFKKYHMTQWWPKRHNSEFKMWSPNPVGDITVTMSVFYTLYGSNNNISVLLFATSQHHFSWSVSNRTVWKQISFPEVMKCFSSTNSSSTILDPLVYLGLINKTNDWICVCLV